MGSIDRGGTQVVFDRVSQPAFQAHVHRMGELLRDGLVGLHSPNIKEVRGRGLLVGVQVDLARLGVPDVTPILAKYGPRRHVLRLN